MPRLENAACHYRACAVELSKRTVGFYENESRYIPGSCAVNQLFEEFITASCILSLKAATDHRRIKVDLGSLLLLLPLTLLLL